MESIISFRPLAYALAGYASIILLGYGLLLAPRGCSVPAAAGFTSQAGKPRPWSGFRAAQSAYLPARLPRPVKVLRDSLGHVVKLHKLAAVVK